MKKALVLLLGVWFVALLIGSVAARDVANPGLRPAKAWSESENPMLSDPGLRGLYEEAAVDTYCLVWYTFDSPAAMNWQGWTKLDITGQRGTFFHVDSLTDMGGGLGSLYPMEGKKSMWCGARPGTDYYMCGWVAAPGYGMNWNQLLKTAPFAFRGALHWTYTMFYQSEGGWDFTRVEYDAGGVWQEAVRYSSNGGDTALAVTHDIFLTQAQTKLRFHFTSDGNTCDEDGLLDTDGGCIVDMITVNDDGPLINNYEDFELAPQGATSWGMWIGAPESGYGSFAGLKTGLIDKDPCGDDFTTQIVYFIGSLVTSTSYPGLFDTPFCTGPGARKAPCQNEQAVSPVIDMTRYSTACNYQQNAAIPVGDLALLGGTIFRYQVYRDLPLDNLVFYTWGVRTIVDGCPQVWQDRGFVYYGPDMDYLFTGENLSDILGTNLPVQIAFGVIDMADAWYPSKGTGANHTPTPWFDNIRLYRYKTAGPQWAVRDIDLFQDNFPESEETIESFVRADMANDINLDANPIILPGDSIVVDATSLMGGGIGTDPTFGGPAVYLHVLASYVGPGYKPDVTGERLAGEVETGGDVPYTLSFNYVGMDGDWAIIQCDSARAGDQVVLDKWMVDLNDTLFTRGYYVEYYFTAMDDDGNESCLPRWAHAGPPYYEFLCLPTLNSDVLFVDDFTGRGSFVGSVEAYWMPVFDAVLAPPNNKVDKYDVNGPSSGVCNGPGSRAKDLQMQENYNKIVWDCGDLESYTISDGAAGDKSPDCQMLNTWMDQSDHTCGLWICGDDIAYELDGLGSLPASTLMGDWCGVDFVATSFFDVTGGRPNGIVNPLITGDLDANFGLFPPGDAIFVHGAVGGVGGVADKFYAYGGCFIINQFDVLAKTASGKWAASYPLYGGTPRYAAIASSQLNSSDDVVNTMWFGFSYQYVRDNTQAAPMDRFELAKNVFDWMQNTTNTNVTDAVTPKSTKLAQNFPNPFNPSTTIKFDLKDKGFVTLKVYNVAGQLIRTLVNGVRDASIVSNPYTVNWDGTNDRGIAVASGIYFYKLDTKDFSQTKKMVMLR